MTKPCIEVTTELVENAESLAARGLTMDQIADCLGMASSTFYVKKAHYIELSEAIKRGKSKGISIVANCLFESAKAGNTTAQIFYLKCRADWIDKTDHKHDVTVRQEDAVKELD